MGIYEYYLPKADGTEVSLKEYEGKVMLIVNTATGCGFTPQYKDLEKIYEEFHDGGFPAINLQGRHLSPMRKLQIFAHISITLSFHSLRNPK